MNNSSEKSERNESTLEAYSDEKNSWGMKVSKAKPIGLISAIITFSALLFLLLNFDSSSPIISFLLTIPTIFLFVASLMFSVSERTTEKFDRYMKNANRTDDHTNQEAEIAASNMKHEINPEVLLKKRAGRAPIDRLDDNEELQYLLTGFDLDIDDNDKGSNSMLLVTNKKVVMIASSITAKTSQYTVSFKDIIGLSVQRRFTSQIRIQTAGHSYKISAAGSSPELADDVVEYIRKQKERADSGTQVQKGESALEKVEKLAELRNSGAISDEEFEDKKSQLMDEI